MSREQPSFTTRADLIEALDRAQRQASGQGVLVSQVLADQLGMHSSDLEALGFLLDEGAISAGRLATLTGLTTGAVTRMIDRLERGGYVRREPDPSDRRKVMVHLVPEQLGEIMRHYEPITQAAHDLYAHYTDEELTLILDYLNRAYEVGLAETARLRTIASQADGGESTSKG